MSTDQTEYEIFISYARLDNQPIPKHYPHGWVTAVVQKIAEDHRQYETSPLRIFFDVQEIKDMDDWRDRILGALRRSRVLLICLSPNYFQSSPCRWEWDEYLARQHQKLVGSEPHATVYFVDVPRSDEHENSKRLDAIMAKNFTDLRPYFPWGAAEMASEAVRQKMAALGQSLWQRLQRSRRALSVPAKLRDMTPYFVGRNREIADLHRMVGVGKIGLVTAVHGLGGQGKTELAVAYARGYADSYTLGLWQLEAENKSELLPLIGSLGLMPEFRYTPPENEKNDAELLGRGVLMELARRADSERTRNSGQAPAALLILDNVSEESLLGNVEVAKLPKVDWLRIIATTRLDPSMIDPARKQVEAVEVASLDLENGLRLIVDHLPSGRFASEEDEAAAREIVLELGGFTLAVEQVAVFLGLNAGNVTPQGYLQRLRAEGLHGTDGLVDAKAERHILHESKVLKPILEIMLRDVEEAGQTLLQFAALLPPERIPWPWLKSLTIARYPHLSEKQTGYADPWLTLRRQIEGLRFLIGSREDKSARMHRLISAHLSRECDLVLCAELTQFVAGRADQMARDQAAPADWELDGMLDAIPHLLKRQPNGRLAVLGMYFSNKVLRYRSVPSALTLLERTREVIKAVAEAEPTNVQAQRELSSCYNKLGDAWELAGVLASATRHFEEGLAVAEKIAEVGQEIAEVQCDLFVSYNKLCNVSIEARELAIATQYAEKGMAIARRLAERNEPIAEAQHYLSISYNKRGEVSMAAGDLVGAQRSFKKGLDIRKKLAKANPTNDEAQRYLSICYNQLGGVHMEMGHRTRAKRYFGLDLAITRKLADRDSTNAQTLHELTVSYDRLGNVIAKEGDLASAEWYFKQGLAIAIALVERDAMSAQAQRDLSIGYNNCGDVIAAKGHLNVAQRYFKQGLTIRRRLAVANATSALAQRDLAVSFFKLAMVAESSKSEKAAALWWRECLQVLEQRAHNEWHISPEELRIVEFIKGKLSDLSGQKDQ